MKKLLILVTIFLMVFANSMIFAQDEEDVEKDNLELTFITGLNIPSGDIKTFGDSLGAKSRFAFGIDIGRFMTPEIVVGFNFTYTEFSIDNKESDSRAEGLKHRLYQPNFYLKYYFPIESNWSPYVKLHGGMDFAKFTTFVENVQGNRYRSLSYDPVFGFGFGAGLFYYTSDYSGLYLEANYHMASTSETEGNYEGKTYIFGDSGDGVGIDLKQTEIRLGIRVLFGDE